MDECDIEVDTIVDDYLAEEMCCNADDAYDRYRDMWSDNLNSELKRIYEEFVKPSRHGYYSGMNAKFLEHSVNILKGLTKCELVALNNNIVASAITTTEKETEVVINKI